MHSRVIPRQVSFVFYEDDPNHYTGGGAQVFLFGDRGFMYGVHGAKFFASFVPQCLAFMDNQGLRTLEGYMSPKNARSARIAFCRQATIVVQVEPVRLIDGHEVCWVRVEKEV